MTAPEDHLDLLKNALLELPLDLLTLLVRRRLAVQVHQGTQVELGRLEELDLADVDLQGIVLAIRPPKKPKNNATS